PIEGPGVRADEALKAAENVYVAGDIAFHHHPLLGRAIRVEHWEVAKGQGRGIATSIAAGKSTPYAKVPYFWSDQYDVSLEYRGNASGEDQAVWRGDRDGLHFSVFYLRDGMVDAVLSMNDKEAGAAGAKLIESRHKVDAKALSDGKDRPEVAVLDDAHEHLDSGRRHALDHERLDLLADRRHALRDVLRRRLDLVRTLQVEAHRARVRLADEPGDQPLQRHLAAELLGRVASIVRCGNEH